jgi:hypothetical protein
MEQCLLQLSGNVHRMAVRCCAYMYTATRVFEVLAE